MANIVDNLLGILGSKKDDGQKKGKYFLELNETEDPKPSQVVAKAEAAVSQVVDKAAKTIESVKPQVEEAAAQLGDKVSKTVESVKPHVEEAAAQVSQAVSDVVDSDKDKKKGRTSVKDRATKKQEAKSQTAPAADPQPVAKTPQVTKPTEPQIKTFAPNYLNTVFNTTSRRRPGPSLNTFKNMANEVGRRK